MGEIDKTSELAPGQCLLFVYGQLQPNLRVPVTCRRWWPDRVRGQLFDLGPYPAAVEVGQVDSSFSGWVLEIDSRELKERLDPYEAVAEGVYRRIRTRTESGTEVWIYEYCRTLPSTAIGPIDRWPRPGSEPPSVGALRGAQTS